MALLRVATVLWAGVIFAGSATPGSRVPGRFGYLAHFIEYAVFGALLSRTTHRDDDPVGGSMMAVAIASAYAVTDEVHQAFVPMRSVDPRDWIVDTAGALTAVLVIAAARYIASLTRRQ